MVNQVYPSVNEHESSWADIQLTMNVPGGASLKIIDFSAIKWKRTVTVGSSRNASGGRVIKRTAGSQEVEASAVVSRSGHAQITEALETAAIAAGQVRGNEVIISGISFDLLVKHTPLGQSRIYVAKLVGCRYLSDGDDSEEGSDPDTLDIDLSPIQILTKSRTGQWIALR